MRLHELTHPNPTTHFVDAPRTAQIQHRATNKQQAVARDVSPTADTLVQAAETSRPTRPIQSKEKKRKISSKPIAAQLKHGVVQNKLTRQLVRQSNIVKPTAHDIEVAVGRAQTALKRAKLDFDRRQDDVVRKRKRESRRTHAESRQ